MNIQLGQRNAPEHILDCEKKYNEGKKYEDIEDAAECLINNIPYAGTRK